MANDSFRNVNKDNVWSNKYIDDFKEMIDNHHKSLNSFQKVGTMLETSSRIYGLKVDSLHNDVLRLSSGIRRENIIPVNESISESDVTIDTTHRSIRKRRSCTMIAGNKETINAKLQTMNPPSNLWNRIDTATDVPSKKLLQNILASENYALSLQPKKKLLFADQDAMNMEDESTILTSASVDLPITNWIPNTSNSIRTNLAGYRITDSTVVANIDQLDVEMDDDDASSIDLRFDIDVDMMPQSDPIELDPAVMNPDLFTEDDRNALLRCSVLQRSNVGATDDLRPLSCSPLVYSYRRLTEGQLPTDANYWKLPSIVQHQQNSEVKKKPIRRRRRKVKKDKPVVCRLTVNETVDRKFVSVDDDRIKKANQMKWDPIKLKIPSKIPSSTAISLLPSMINCLENDDSDAAAENSNIEMDSTANGYDGEIDSNSDSNEVHVVNNVDVGMDDIQLVNGVNDMDEVDGSSNEHEVVMSPMPVPQPRIQPLQFIQITPSNVDAKQITRRCLEIICALEDDGGEATFAQIYHRLQTNNQVISPSVTFSSILELAGKNNFRLEKIGENDFVIKRNLK